MSESTTTQGPLRDSSLGPSGRRRWPGLQMPLCWRSVPAVACSSSTRTVEFSTISTINPPRSQRLPGQLTARVSVQPRMAASTGTTLSDRGAGVAGALTGRVRCSRSFCRPMESGPAPVHKTRPSIYGSCGAVGNSPWTATRQRSSDLHSGTTAVGSRWRAWASSLSGTSAVADQPARLRHPHLVTTSTLRASHGAHRARTSLRGEAMVAPSSGAPRRAPARISLQQLRSSPMSRLAGFSGSATTTF